jgi:hypothetical protein
MRNQSLWSYNKFLARKKHRLEEIQKLKANKLQAKFVALTPQQYVDSENAYDKQKQLLIKKYPSSWAAMQNKEDQMRKRIPYVYSGTQLKGFMIKWFKAITNSVKNIIEKEQEFLDWDPESPEKSPKNPVAGFRSRSELSNTRPKEERESLYLDKNIRFSDKGFFGAPLPLIPDVRKTEVETGIVGLLLEAFGVNKTFERTVNLYKGPNKKFNRYLVFQYKRLINSIDGKLVNGTMDEASHIVWSHNFYKLTAADNEMTSKERKILKKKVRKYWGIGNQLIRNSIAFRTAVLKKTLGKPDRWFHRHFSIEDLFEIFKKYQFIADRFSTGIEIRRAWISAEMRDGSYKWRPLGIADYPWRIFTRGLNNILETFISSGWPENQHGYKSKRGVHTAWNKILRTVIYAKNIMEFDFTGFFNTVRVEAVGDVLNRYMVPKYMIAYFFNVSTGEIKNIDKKSANKYLKSKKKSEQGWGKAWLKYEYIHLYRKGYRWTGLPQGFALSPILSVLTLICLDDLKKLGIKYILYADDGLFYSEKEADYLEEAQKILDKYGTGAYFNKSKCKLIKTNGHWIDKLKFVGLEYNPSTDILSAATRNGATLKLQIGTIGYFSKQELSMHNLDYLIDYKLKGAKDTDAFTNWRSANKKIFDVYETIYLLENYGKNQKAILYETLISLTTEIMANRFRKYGYEELCTICSKLEDDDITLEIFLFPMRVLYNISKVNYHNMIDKYVLWTDSPFPPELLLENGEIKGMFWMDWEQDAENYNKILKEKIADRSNKKFGKNYNIPEYSLSAPENLGLDTVLKEIKWFHQQDEVPESLKPYLNNGEIDLGKWFALKAEEASQVKLPEVVVDHLKQYGGTIAYSVLNWRNLYMDPAFATLIARLFQNSLRSGVIKQNFKLTTDKSCLNLVRIIDRYIGRKQFQEMLQGDSINIFNSSTFCANLLINLANTWVPCVKSNQARKIPMYKRVYKTVIKRIVKRRTCANQYTDSYLMKVYNWAETKVGLRKPGGYDMPLTAYENYATDRHRATWAHLKAKYKNITSLPLEAIIRSAIATHYMHMSYRVKDVTDPYSFPLKNVVWDTLESKHKRTPNLSKKKTIIKWTKLKDLYKKVGE